MDLMQIWINSANRANIGIKTVAQMPEDWHDRVFIAVPSCQFKQYVKQHKGIGTIVKIPKSVPKFLSSQRQWVAENANSNCHYVWMMDDDLKFMFRDDEMKLKNAEEAHMDQMWIAMMEHLSADDMACVGISTRLGNNRETADYADISRVTRCFAFDVELFMQLGINLAPFEPFCMQDFHMNLSFLEQGYRNRVIYSFAQGDSGSNSKGGCSSYRTPKVLAKVSKWMEKNHKGFVKTKTKRTKGSWEGFEKDEEGYVTRTDVMIYWKKAYEAAVRRKRTSGGLMKFI